MNVRHSAVLDTRSRLIPTAERGETETLVDNGDHEAIATTARRG